MARFGRSTIYLTGAGVLLLVAFAAFLIIDLGSRSVDPSSLPVIQLGQPTSATPGETSGRPGPGLQQPDGSSPTTASLLGSAANCPTILDSSASYLAMASLLIVFQSISSSKKPLSLQSIRASIKVIEFDPHETS